MSVINYYATPSVSQRCLSGFSVIVKKLHAESTPTAIEQTRMWANAQRDGRPAEHRWRPLFNAEKFA